MKFKLGLVMVILSLGLSACGNSRHSQDGEFDLSISKSSLTQPGTDGLGPDPAPRQVFNPPGYFNYYFLGNTADELTYASYPSYPSYPKYASYPDYASYPGQSQATARAKLVDRAQKVCSYFNFTSAHFVTSRRAQADSSGVSELITIDEQGYAVFQEFKAKRGKSPTYIRTLECSK